MNFKFQVSSYYPVMPGIILPFLTAFFNFVFFLSSIRFLRLSSRFFCWDAFFSSTFLTRFFQSILVFFFCLLRFLMVFCRISRLSFTLTPAVFSNADFHKSFCLISTAFSFSPDCSRSVIFFLSDLSF